MAARRGAVASALGSPGRHAAKRVRIRGRRWTVTFNDRLEYPPSDRWREEAENRRSRQEDVDRAHAAAQCSDQVAEEEEREGAAPDAGVAGRDQRAVGDREGHFRHPTEVCAGLRSHRHLTYYVGQLERGPENGKFFILFLSTAEWCRTS